jgi:hypothetical protein
LRGQLHRLEERALLQQEALIDHSKGQLLNFIYEAQLLAKDADRPRENAVQTGADFEVPAECCVFYVDAAELVCWFNLGGG